MTTERIMITHPRVNVAMLTCLNCNTAVTTSSVDKDYQRRLAAFTVQHRHCPEAA